MELLDAMLVIVSLAEDKATRTVIQKMSYFLEVLDLIDARFRPHYYGPYSDEVQEKLTNLLDLRFSAEHTEALAVPSVFKEGKKYVYSITEDGKEILKRIQEDPEYKTIEKIITICKEESGFDIDILSAAAKICYILQRERRIMSISNIMEEGKRLGWNIELKNIQKVVSLLESLDISRRTS
ncbi:MAG: hypothetical protein HXS54_02855 [Theionarchaea archaeon]|nr:hypothetical protein [Theionarchaea archaeon]